MRKCFFFFVCMLWQLGAWAQFSGLGSGTAADPYLIYNATQLAEINNFLNQEDVVFELRSDIDLAEYIAAYSPNEGWLPIGADGLPFMGTFKGNNHTISNLMIDRPNAKFVGLFGNSSNAKFDNFRICPKSIRGYQFVGAGFGHFFNSELNSVSISATSDVRIEGTYNEWTWVGGFAGYCSSDSRLTNCSLLGYPKIVGYEKMGGFTGEVNVNDYLLNCYAEAIVEGTYHVGGFAGICWANDASHCVNIINCRFKGQVTGVANIGGFIGNNCHDAPTAGFTTNIKDCEAQCDIVGNEDNIGGIIGNLGDGVVLSISNTKHTGTVTNTGGFHTSGIVGNAGGLSVITNCSHSGTIKGYYDVGGIIGLVWGQSTITSCRTDGTIAGVHGIGGIVGFALENQQLRFNDCHSTADIFATYFGAGGILEYSRGYTMREMIYSSHKGRVTGHNFVGGLIGAIISDGCRPENAHEVFPIRFCESDAAVSGYNYVGGIMGYDEHTALNGNNYYTDILDCVVKGIIRGNDYVGGLEGAKEWGGIYRNYVAATIEGNDHVGGLVGHGNAMIMQSCVSACPRISSNTTNCGRVYGSWSGGGLENVGSAQGNVGLSSTVLVKNGSEQTAGSSLQNGQAVSADALRHRGTYTARTWDFDYVWDIEEGWGTPFLRWTKTAAPEDYTDIASLVDGIYVEPAECFEGKSVWLSVKMKNTMATTGYQFDLHLPPGLSFVTDAVGLPCAELSTERTNKNRTDMFSFSLQPDGSLRVLCHSNAGYAFNGNDGEVARVKIRVPSGFGGGDYALIIKDVVLTMDNGHTVNCDYVRCKFTVKPLSLGDVNNDTRVDIGDIAAIANHIMGKTSAPFVIEAADANEDDNVSVGDLTLVAHWILHGKPAASNFRAPLRIDKSDVLGIYMEEFAIEPGKTIVVPINITNPVTTFSGYQFDIVLPEGFHIIDVELSTDRTTPAKADYLLADEIDDGVYRILCFSTQGYTFEDTEGAVVLLTVGADSNVPSGIYNVSIQNSELSLLGETYAPLCYTTSISVGIINNITNISTENADNGVYNLNGHRVNEACVSKGIYINHGQKIVR